MILLLVWLSCAHATPLHAPSAKREPRKSYTEYIRELHARDDAQLTVQESAKPFAVFTTPNLPLWPEGAELQKRFETLRDTRWLDDLTHKNFPRRLAWLYPDDGCFVRAALMSVASNNAHWPQPAKVFIFGDLALTTPFAATGQSEVSWWYHVAEIVRSGPNVLVLDPSVEAERALPLRDWIARLNFSPDKIEVAVCTPSAYSPDDVCLGTLSVDSAAAIDDETEFLASEWNRVEQLHRDPLRDLGDHPPW